MLFCSKLIRKLKNHLFKMNDVPLGIKFLQKATDRCPRLHFNREFCYKASVIFLTYIAYMCYHLSRKPISVVKAVLHRNCSILPTPSPNEPDNWCDWAPFDGSDSMASQMLGELDSAFLFCYAVAMFISGFVAERVNLRYFLALGMLMSGIFSFLFGLGKTYQIHNLWYYILMQGCAGIFQTTGWPGVVTVMSKWFGKSKRGLIFGLWNSHTSIGNILGSLIAAQYVETDWALSFIVPGAIIGVGGFVLFLFLVVNPSDVGIVSTMEYRSVTRSETNKTSSYRHLDNQAENSGSSLINSIHSDSDVDDSEITIGEHTLPIHSTININEGEIQRRNVTERTRLLGGDSATTSDNSQNQAIGFIGALKIPGVVEFSLCLFFSKLVSYTFLYWLPLYVEHSLHMGAALSADLSTLFDVGGIAGAVIAGVATDKSEMPATTCMGMLMLAAPLMYVYQKFSVVSLGINMILLIIVGVLVNGPYALITTAVSAELGTHHSLEDNSKALATVTAIIDGTGSIGAAVGPLLAGFASSYSWQDVFYMLIMADVFAMLLLIRLVKHEVRLKFYHRRGRGRIE